MNSPSYGKLGVIGIRREDKSKWERRTAITPQHVARLIEQHPHLKFVVQPSDKRIFRDIEYTKAGATINDDLSECSVIFGVKEVPIDELMANRTYVYFSHTIKAQDYNMPMLDHILREKIRLVDYEKITDEEGRRLVAFGKFAGNAGALDFLFGIGKYFLNLGFSTPFLNCSYAFTYKNLEKAKEIIRDCGESLAEEGIPASAGPLIFAITSSGRCSQGVLEILECLPIKIVDPDDLESIVQDKDNIAHRSVVYVTFIETQHMVKPADPNKTFSKEDYYTKPDSYVPIFHEKYLPYVSVIFHCMFWDPKYPKLITSEQVKELAEAKKLRLFGICDITCDIEGSIDFLKSYTNLDEPFFLYNPLNGESTTDITKASNDILYQAVDHLPTELAWDSSTYFADKLFPFVENIAMSDITKPFDEQGLVGPIKRAVITSGGQLTPNFAYIARLRKANDDLKLKSMYSKRMPEKRNLSFISLKINGHLFDTKAINQIFDYLEEHKVNFRVLEMEIGQNNSELSSAYLQIFTKNKENFHDVLDVIYDIGDKYELKIEN
jgi:alpha-aminoadipic semialdehyde synthase